MLAVAKRSNKAKKPDDLHQLIIRMTHKVYAELEADAGEHFRSVNMHVLWLIQRRLDERRREKESQSQ
jgi:hypothetical protein